MYYYLIEIKHILKYIFLSHKIHNINYYFYYIFHNKSLFQYLYLVYYLDINKNSFVYFLKDNLGIHYNHKYIECFLIFFYYNNYYNHYKADKINFLYLYQNTKKIRIHILYNNLIHMNNLFHKDNPFCILNNYDELHSLLLSIKGNFYSIMFL